MVVGLVVYCLGNGYNLLLRSLLADLVAAVRLLVGLVQ